MQAEKSASNTDGLSGNVIYQQLIENLPAAVYTCDTNGLILQYNKAAAELWGREPIIGKDRWCGSWKIYHPDGTPMPVDECPMAIAIKEGKTVSNREIIVERPDGKRLNILPHPQPLIDSTGNIIGAVNMLLDITGRREATERMEKLAAIVESSDDAIVSITTDGIVTSWNKGAQRLYGYSSDEMVGQLMNPVIPVNRRQEESEILARIKRGESVEHYETIRVTKAGEMLNVSLMVSPLKDASGKVIGASKSARNISKEKRAERLVLENEQRLQIVIDASELGTWELNVQTKEVAYSKRYLEILGFPDGIILQHHDLLARLHPDDKEIRDKAFEAAFKTGQLHYISRLVWVDNSIHWMEAKGKVFYDQDNTPLKLLGTIRDITEEKLYEQELSENEQKFRLLANSMPQFVWIGDAAGNLNYFNQSVYDYSGLSPEQVAKEGWLQIVHPDERDENIRRWMYSIQTGEPFLFEHRFRRHDGGYRWQMSRAIPQKDNEGKIQMWIGTSTDIHDRKLFTDELEERVQQRTSELNQRNEDLVKSNIELGQFAYVASHDLQEPIRKILTFSTRIMELDGEKLSDTGRDYFNRVQLASIRMRQLIMDLLTYSRTSTADRNFEQVDTTTILKTVLDQLKDTIDQKQAKVSFTNLPTISIIPYQFEQLLTNILTNALKFSKDDVAPVITISGDVVPGSGINSSAPRDASYHRIVIRDNGIGFDPQFGEKIFQVFQRLHGKEDYAGTGIGLSIVRKIVENHNGIITTESAPGKGAAFLIHIPVS